MYCITKCICWIVFDEGHRKFRIWFCCVSVPLKWNMPESWKRLWGKLMYVCVCVCVCVRVCVRARACTCSRVRARARGDVKPSSCCAFVFTFHLNSLFYPVICLRILRKTTETLGWPGSHLKFKQGTFWTSLKHHLLSQLTHSHFFSLVWLIICRCTVCLKFSQQSNALQSLHTISHEGME
jgi:hypothetical protein